MSLKVTVSGFEATDKTVTWSSSDEDVATVTDEGVVTAVSAGKATITATSGKVSATCEITVNAPFVAVETITLDRTTAKVEEGKTVTLKATVRPVAATDQTVTWTSSDETVATVDSKGVVTAVKAGTAVITAKAGEKTATCTVTVTAKVIAVTGITLSQTEATVEVGEPLTLVATVTPDNATDKTVTWSSSDENVATVDQDGKVTTLATGKVTITAEAGDYSAECVVTVSKTTGVALVGFDADAPVKVYNLCGQYVADTVEGLQPGLYIVRQGDEAKKVQIR